MDVPCIVQWNDLSLVAEARGSHGNDARPQRVATELGRRANAPAQAGRRIVIASSILLDERSHQKGLVVQIVDTTELVVARARQADASRDLNEANEKLILAGLREQVLAERAKRSEARVKAVLARESLLANASRLLASSLDYNITLQRWHASPCRILPTGVWWTSLLVVRSNNSPLLTWIPRSTTLA